MLRISKLFIFKFIIVIVVIVVVCYVMADGGVAEAMPVTTPVIAFTHPSIHINTLAFFPIHSGVLVFTPVYTLISMVPISASPFGNAPALVFVRPTAV